MKKSLENIKWGFLFGLTALITLILWWTIYALVNNIWTPPNNLEANPWNTLNSASWNAILSNQNALSWALNNLPWTHYSTDEIWTWNYWINEKKIYRKVIAIPDSVIVAETPTGLWVIIPDWENLIDCYVLCDNISNIYSVIRGIIYYFDKSTKEIQARTLVANSEVKFTTTSNCSVVAEYTKTTN
jgi:hypothetical protein